MRVPALVAVGILALAATAHAQFNAYYEGMTHMAGKDLPLTTRFSVDKDRVATVMVGARSSRILYFGKEDVLRVIDEDTRSYFDLDRKALAQITGGAMAEMQKQMAAMPPAQRAMMEKMAPGALANMGGMGSMTEKPLTYVWSQETKTVNGYACTRVDVMRGDQKRAEYWGSTSPDFKLSDDERRTVAAMHECLSGLTIVVRGGAGGGGDTRAFQWDTRTDGYPLISRCFDDSVMTLDVHLVRFDRKPLEDDLFKVPAGYKRQEISGAGDGKRRGRPE